MDAAITLDGRVALVTGGSRGIGRGIAQTLARAGAAVAVNYRGREDEAAATVAAIERAGGTAVAVRANVADRAEVEAMAARVGAALGPIDVLINNAGIATIRGLDDLTEADFDETLAVNLKSAFLCTQTVVPGMRSRGWGRIVNISSVAARGAGGVGVHYNASKAGLEGLTRGYSARLAADGITVNAVAPGLVDTEMAAPLKEAGVADRLPVGRIGAPEEIGRAVLMVLTNGYLTGQTIAVNGGGSFI
ncbi:3-oxoacyl-[acyl-carrier protein] reductase [Nocardia transvalensis]|uniref:3-oxoacyl-[acyl-carrier-protein] reductase MabA n=1 Tax=Nocardia transvalensis TaxID=37333 RepID=A0A7W9PGH1_9NOCA|nr:SDR family NAD(P)-dependent oxidoreductase [Nocardia transvalensis]MBB5915746.1 3-oxoacyl-[acyl-carrier protein] reductase [Nocardia transvalensis]